MDRNDRAAKTGGANIARDFILNVPGEIDDRGCIQALAEKLGLLADFDPRRRHVMADFRRARSVRDAIEEGLD